MEVNDSVSMRPQRQETQLKDAAVDRASLGIGLVSHAGFLVIVAITTNDGLKGTVHYNYQFVLIYDFHGVSKQFFK